MDILAAQKILRKAFFCSSSATNNTHLKEFEVDEKTKNIFEERNVWLEVLTGRTKEAEALIETKEAEALAQKKDEKKSSLKRKKAPSPFFNTAEWIIETCLKFLEKEKIIDGYTQSKNLDQQKIDFLIFFQEKKIPLQVKRSGGGVLYHLASPQGMKIPVICVHSAHGLPQNLEIAGVTGEIFRKFDDANKSDCIEAIKRASYALHVHELIQILYLNRDGDFSFVKTV